MLTRRDLLAGSAAALLADATGPSFAQQTAHTRVGLRLPARLSFERWQALGRQIGSVATASSWWLGDWVLFGEDHYGRRYRTAISTELPDGLPRILREEEFFDGVVDAS